MLSYQLQGIALSQTVTKATPGQDVTSNNSIVIPDGSDSGIIHINIINDNIPEQDETFFVNITSVHLKGSNNTTSLPRIGGLRSIRIQINANDGTQGELAFAAKFAR